MQSFRRILSMLTQSASGNLFFSKPVQTIPPDDFFIAFKDMIKNNDIEAINSMIIKAHNLNYSLASCDPKTKYSLLHFVVTKANKQNEQDMIKILDALVAGGADINQHAMDKSHCVPLHTAARRGLILITKWLLDHDVDRNIKDFKDGKPYQTALNYVEKSLVSPDAEKSKISKLQEIAALLRNYQTHLIPLNSLPIELQLDISERLTPAELNTLSSVNKAASDYYRQDYIWKKRIVSLGPSTQGAYYGQFWQKMSLVKQKAKLLANTFLQAPPGFTGPVFAGFDFYYEDFMDFAPEYLIEHIFNDPNIYPLAIIDYAFTFLGLTPSSYSPHDVRKTTLLHTLANLGMPTLLNEYIAKYKDRLDIDLVRELKQ